MAVTSLGRQRQSDANSQSDEVRDDYIVEREDQQPRTPASLRIIRFLQAILIIVIAILSFAVFWMVGLIIGIF